MKRDTYCEFVSGVYTYDIDLRRTLSFQGLDFSYKYYDEYMREGSTDEAKFVHFNSIGRYYDEDVYKRNGVKIKYSSLISLPNCNRVVNSYLNILTTLQAERVLFLVKNGMDYDTAKEKSHIEIINQIKSSSYFSLFMSSKDINFTNIDISNELIYNMTKYVSLSVNRIVDLSISDSSEDSVWDEFVMQYSTTGQMDLANIEPNMDDPNIYVDAYQSLKVTIAQYHIPFVGGVPLLKGDKIFYGIDTTTYVGKRESIADRNLIVRSPIYKEFECNGYFNINAYVRLDSLNSSEDICVRIDNKNSNKSDTTYIISNNTFVDRVSSVIWLSENSKYKVDLIFGKDSISYEVYNKIDLLDY